MTDATTPQARFYRDRHLPRPTQELVPATTEALRDDLRALAADETSWRVVGDGQHLRPRATPALPEEWTALRMESLTKILDLDERSGVVRVEAGISWQALEDQLADRGFGLQRYGLHPNASTIGGLLARRRAGPARLRGGALIDGCIAIGGFSPDGGDYRYLAAPRKASGPDLRYRFMGDAGREGVIFDATLVVWRPQSERLLRYRDCSLERAREIVTALFEGEINPCWLHYGLASRSLQLSLAGPGQLLRSQLQWLEQRLGSPDEVGDDDDARRRRRWLQARHPDRRAHPDALSTRVVVLAPSALNLPLEELFGPGLVDLEILEWTPQTVEIFARYDQPIASIAPPPLPTGACWAHWSLIDGP